MADRSHDGQHEKSQGKGRSLGRFLITHYTYALESDPVHAHSPKVKAPGMPEDRRYRRSFLGLPYGVEMQGTGRTEDGHYLHYVGGGRYHAGVGGSAGTPEAWHSIAVDTRVIPLGSRVEIEAYKDKGPFIAKDTGGAIVGQHVDVFAGAIPIAQAYALGEKHSEVRLLDAHDVETPGQHSGGQHSGGQHSGGQHSGGQHSGGQHSGGQHSGAGKAGSHGHTGHHAREQYSPAPSLVQVEADIAVIRRGMEGESVRFVQVHLEVTVDGQFGPITEAALIRFQRRHGLEVDAIVGVHTLRAMHKHGGGQHGNGQHGGGQHGNGQHGNGQHGNGQHGNGQHGNGQHGGHDGGHDAGGSDPVAIARRLVGLPSWSPTLRHKLSPYYDNAGRRGNNCAEFVSAVLQKAGRITFNEPGVENLKSKLLRHGWRALKAHEHVHPGDVWIDDENPQHTVLVSSSTRGGNTIGADGSSDEYVKEEPMPYPNPVYLRKD